MAATWDSKITVKDLARKEVSLRSTRTDGEDVRTFHLDSMLVDTTAKPLSEIKADAVNKLFAEYEAEATKDAAMAAMLTGWEAALNAALDAKETS